MYSSLGVGEKMQSMSYLKWFFLKYLCAHSYTFLFLFLKEYIVTKVQKLVEGKESVSNIWRWKMCYLLGRFKK